MKNQSSGQIEKKTRYRICPMPNPQSSEVLWQSGPRSKTIVVGERQKHTKTVVYNCNMDF